MASERSNPGAKPPQRQSSADPWRDLVTTPSGLTIPRSLTPIPGRIVDELFARFAARWKAKWTSDLHDETAHRIARQQWAEDLAGMTREQIGLAVRGTRDLEWPPSPWQFRQAGGCKPEADDWCGWVDRGRAVGVQWRGWAYHSCERFIAQVIEAEAGHAKG